MADSLASGSLGGDIISRGASPRSEHQLCEVTGITGLPDDGAEVHVQASLDFLDTRRTVQPLDGGFQYAAVASKLCVPAFHLLTGCMPPLTPGLAEAVRAGRTSHLPAPPAAEEVPPEGLRAASAFWGGFSRMDAWVPLVAPLDFTPDGQQEHVLWHPASCSMVSRRPALAQAHAHPRGSARDRRMVVSTPVSRRSSPGSSARGLRLRGRRQSISSAGDAASEGMEGLDGTDDDPDEAHAALLPDMSPRTGPAFMPVGSRPGAPTFGQPAGTSVSGAGFARMPPLDAAGSRHAVRSASSRGLRPRHPANGHSFGAMSIGSGAESAGVETAGGSSGGAGLEASEYAAAADDRVICGQLLFRGQTRVSRRFWVTRFVVVDEDDCTLARYKDEQDYERAETGAHSGGPSPAGNQHRP
ncbi:hypothetical protein FNF28_02622 [Cafeteria roenbergensis]|uniref:PH domain-containing protein n=1 Tax=Cafeteria roenbergensis TaxID=33653 RepID=A0A5A8DU62_CAFRO|nr:hypothetical protein FNF28_02622 [Cafeteria roenbergensis]